MDFAKKQLEKYGWADGKGLGKNEDGIRTAIKPKLKFDTSGIGHEIGAQFSNNWWERVFNNASKNINVQIENNQVQLKLNSKEPIEISTKSYSLKKIKHLKYGSFIKTAKLTESGSVEQIETNSGNIEPMRNFNNNNNNNNSLTDEELFAACGGRTAHKGARHGLKLNGKLSRIEKQERMLLKKLRNVSISDKAENIEKKMKKLKKQNANTSTSETSEVETCAKSSKKKNTKKQKSVTFNDETVTKYYTPEDDTTPSLGDENIGGSDSSSNGYDEGIEQDLENNNSELEDDNHKSFEEAQCSFNDLSKAERQKLKKKRKLENKNGATAKFLQEFVGEKKCPTEEVCSKCKKRKMTPEDADVEQKQEKLERNSKKKKYMTEKRKKKKERKRARRENKMMNSITLSLDHFCKISDDE